MNLSQALAIVKPLPGASQNISASSAGKCSCRGACGTHVGPCVVKANEEMCASCGKLADDLEAGGPGSGRHKSGMSMMQKQSVMHLRHAGFKTSAKHSLSGQHAMSMTDSTGKTHVMNFSPKGVTHSVSTGANPTKFKTVGQTSHKNMGTYASTNFASYHGPMAGSAAPSDNMKDYFAVQAAASLRASAAK